MATDATFVTNIDLSNLELRNAKAHILSADPAAVEGKIIYNSTTKQLKYHDGTSWVSAGGAPLANLSGQAAAFGQAAANGSATTAARSDHYHALPAVPALNSIPVPTGAVAMNGQKITGLAAGTTNGDAIRYEQLVGQYLPIGGGNLTGNLGLTNTGIDWKNASNVKRWNARLAGTEGGSESGAMLMLFSYTDAGVESAGLVQIDRGSGSTYVAGTLRSATGMSVGNKAGVGQIQVQPVIGSYTGFTLRNGTSGTDMFTLDVYDSAAYVSGTLKYLDAGSWLFNKPVGMGSNKITGLADGTNPQDAATVAQVQAAATGLDVKASVRAVIASNIDPGDSSYANSTYADGVAVAVDERVLLIGQTNPAENGIWIKKPGTTGMLRGSDADTSAKVTPNMFVFVESGTNYADTGWVLTTDGPITLGTTGLTFTQFFGPGQYVWGNGLANSGRTINVGAGTGITVAADTVAIDTAVVARKSSTTLSTSATSYVVTHNLNTRDVQVSVVQVGSPYGVIYTAWEATSVNTVTVYFATAPTANTLRVNVVG